MNNASSSTREFQPLFADDKREFECRCRRKRHDDRRRCADAEHGLRNDGDSGRCVGRLLRLETAATDAAVVCAELGEPFERVRVGRTERLDVDESASIA